MSMMESAKLEIEESVRVILCLQRVQKVIPNYCPKALLTLCSSFSCNDEAVVHHCLDVVNNDPNHPRPQIPARKRKLNYAEDDEEEAGEVTIETEKYDNPIRRQEIQGKVYITASLWSLKASFPLFKHTFITETYVENNRLLLPTFLSIHEVIITKDNLDEITINTEIPIFPVANPLTLIRATPWFAVVRNMEHDEAEKVRLELDAAILVQAHRNEVRTRLKKMEQANKQKYDQAVRDGKVSDCQCCFVDHPVFVMVKCNGPKTHLFCVDCARQNAETQLGLARHDLQCMATDGCHGGFSHDQRKLFLDSRLTRGLDALEAEEAVNAVELEGLVKCPFCPFAAECPPISEDREFRCQSEDCGKVSCRRCQKESHLPQTCEEIDQDGLSARRRLEEARSEALIRKCNKCGTPFIKTIGCNLMRCTKAGCNNKQCYLCSKSCDYRHFRGSCKLWSSAEAEHDRAVEAADAAARQELFQENPDLDAANLDINMADRVAADDLERRRRDPDHVDFDRNLFNANHADDDDDDDTSDDDDSEDGEDDDNSNNNNNRAARRNAQRPHARGPIGIFDRVLAGINAGINAGQEEAQQHIAEFEARNHERLETQPDGDPGRAPQEAPTGQQRVPDPAVLARWLNNVGPNPANPNAPPVPDNLAAPIIVAALVCATAPDDNNQNRRPALQQQMRNIIRSPGERRNEAPRVPEGALGQMAGVAYDRWQQRNPEANRQVVQQAPVTPPPLQQGHHRRNTLPALNGQLQPANPPPMRRQSPVTPGPQITQPRGSQQPPAPHGNANRGNQQLGHKMMAPWGRPVGNALPRAFMENLNPRVPGTPPRGGEGLNMQLPRMDRRDDRNNNNNRRTP